MFQGRSKSLTGAGGHVPLGQPSETTSAKIGRSPPMPILAEAPAGMFRAEAGSGGKDPPTFDGLLDLLSQQHHQEVAQLRNELRELSLSRPIPAKNKIHAAVAKLRTPSSLQRLDEEVAQAAPCGGAREQPGAVATLDDALGVLPGAPMPQDPPRCGSIEDNDSPSNGGDDGVASPNRTVSAASALGEPFTEDFELLETWTVHAVEPKQHWSRTMTITSSLHRNGSDHAVSRYGGNAMPIMIAQPTSPSRITWHFFGALLILFDLFKLPIEHAFQPEETDFSRAMDWIILIYWTLNIPASLTEGYLEHGVIVLSPRKILVKYMRTWFPVDALVLVPDWTFTIGSLFGNGRSDDNESKAFTRFLNVARLARIVRLIRLLKLRRILDTLNDMTTSEHTSLMLNIVSMFVTLLLISHQIGCAWYAIGNSSQNSSTASWTANPELTGNGGWVYMYLTSVHWSVAQFTPATIEVHPENLVERVFAIIVVIFALLGFTYILGSVTGSLAQLRGMRAEESTLFWDLRRYLLKNKVTRRLSRRIQKYLEYAWRLQQERKPAKSIRLMALLSEQLFSELQCELAVAHLRVHPFLFKLCHLSHITVQRLANSAISHKLVASGDYLFYPGEEATHLWIVVEGSSEYTKRDSSGILCREKVTNNEDWIAEPVLWSKWVHRGLLTALEDGDVLAIDSNKFCSVVRLNPKAHSFASRYAHNFIKWLNDLDVDELTDISQGEDVGDLVESFMCYDDDGQEDDDEGEKIIQEEDPAIKSTLR